MLLGVRRLEIGMARMEGSELKFARMVSDESKCNGGWINYGSYLMILTLVMEMEMAGEGGWEWW